MQPQDGRTSDIRRDRKHELKLTDEQEQQLAVYRELWTDYNSTQALIDELQNRLRKIKSDQRRLANLLAVSYAEKGND